jgi:ketosteroid isomerase-like protein
MKTPLELAQASLEATRNLDRDGWLALFEPDAVVEDPVGVSPTDPEGLGHRGIEGIAAFHDSVIKHVEKFDFEIERSYTCGEEVAVAVNFQIVTGGGSMDMDLINIYKRSPNGKLQSLRSFWDGSRQRP